MDDATTLRAQMEQEAGRVVLINTFTVEPEDEDQFLKAWATVSMIQKQQPGFISAQLGKGRSPAPCHNAFELGGRHCQV